MEIFTIGVYGFDRDSFLEALKTAKIDVLVDIRRRRGVRGPLYAFANSQRLQDSMADAGIGYVHNADLAPGVDIVQQQVDHDTSSGESIRNRAELLPAFREDYHRLILDDFDFDAFLQTNQIADGRICFMCVETTANACHRGMVAERMQQRYGWPVTHLEPKENH